MKFWPFSLAVAGIVLLDVFQPDLLRFRMPYPAVNHDITTQASDDVPPDPRPLQGPLALNYALRNATKLFQGMAGAETVAVAANGTLILADKHNRVWTAELTTGVTAEPTYMLSARPIALLGNGRPLGATVDKAGNVLICDSLKGLLMLDKDDPRRVTFLATAVSDDSPLDPGTPIKFANSVAVASDGRVFFTTSQEILPYLKPDGTWDTLSSCLLGMYSGVKSGRLLVYDPATHETHVLAKGFFFANGVALSADESFALVVETVALRVWRVWLNGPQAGAKEVLIDALPGFPDGISRAPDGGFWVSIVAPVNPALKAIRFRPIAWLLSWVPVVSWHKILGFNNPFAIKPWGCIVKLSPSGEIVSSLQDPGGQHIAFVSAVTQHGDRLWIGNVHHDYISYIDV